MDEKKEISNRYSSKNKRRVACLKKNYYSASKKSKIVIAAIEGKLTQAQLTSEYGVPPTQIKAWKQTALQAIADAFSNARDKDKKEKQSLSMLCLKKLVDLKRNYLS